ncbi:MAG: acyl-CoA dehydrogenase family protein [Gammaproteobacteria bacterium]|nr:acyl-CoA dehydrogenase family protein [Gammaproteobacteria bacterium]
MTVREQIFSWVEETCPDQIRGSDLGYSGGHRERISNPAFQSWFDACVQRGLTAPEWPERYGGAGLDKAGATAFRAALEKVGAPLPLTEEVSRCSARPCSNSATKTSGRASYQKLSEARCAGARDTRNRAPAPISRRCKHVP